MLTWPPANTFWPVFVPEILNEYTNTHKHKPLEAGVKQTLRLCWCVFFQIFPSWVPVEPDARQPHV